MDSNPSIIGPSRVAELANAFRREGALLPVVFVSSILFAGMMTAGYAVFDELSLYGILAAFLFWTDKRAFRFSAPEMKLEWLHKIFFILLCGYLILETFRGMIALGDIRVLRFTGMFAALGFVCWSARGEAPGADAYRLPRIVVGATAAYFACYLLFGAVAETIFGVWRFDLQGALWVGTTAAFVPGIVVLPALLLIGMSDEARDRRLFWITTALLLVCGFYYQSRLESMGLIVLMGGLLLAGERKRALGLVCAYFLFIVFFPWTYTHPLTVRHFAADLTENVVHPQPLGYIARFGDAVFGSFVHIPVLTKTKVAQLESRQTKLEAASGRELAKGGLGSAGGESAKGGSASAGGEASKGGVESAGPSADQLEEEAALIKPGETVDLDRKIALRAAISTLAGQPLLGRLFGTGYYTHRFVMLPYIHALAKEVGWHFPETYNTIVRTATFNGMLVDTGVIGIGAFLSLFGFVALTAIMLLWRVLKSQIGLLAVCFGALALLGMSLFAGSNFDMVLLYLALMPFGPLTGAIRSAKILSEQAVVGRST